MWICFNYMQNIHKLIFFLVLFFSLFSYFVSLSSQHIHIVLSCHAEIMLFWDNNISQSAHMICRDMHQNTSEICDEDCWLLIHYIRSVKIDIHVDSAKESARRDLKMIFRKTFSDCLMTHHFYQENYYMCQFYKEKIC